MKNVVTVFILFFLFLTGCNTVKTSNNNNRTLKSSWVLQNENEAELGLSDEPITLVFDEENDNTISGFAGCNFYGGDYVMNNDQLMVSDVHSTKRACPSLEVENEYLSLLKQVDTFQIKGNNLYLYRGKLLLLHFKR